VIKLNITATTRLTRAVLPGLLSRGTGAIVNVASVLAFMTIPGSSVSAAAKAYIVSFSQALQKEVEGTGVLVQILVPSATSGTGFWDAAGFAITNFPSQIVMTPEIVVEAALRGLDRKEQFVFPGLADAAEWGNFDADRQKFAGAIASGKLAAHYTA
jgi:short-subunit dehydrogenase